MEQTIRLGFYGPGKLEGEREVLDKTFHQVLKQFLEEKHNIFDYKVKAIDYKGQRLTKIIGAYFYQAIAKVEVKEQDFYNIAEQRGIVNERKDNQAVREK